MSDRSGVIAHPAATVILLRGGARACEVLLVRRNPQLAFHGGAWAFPGGRVDPGDYAAGDEVMAAARRAAVREAREEAGVSIDLESLLPLSRWITPEGLLKRFDTWFFAAPAPPERVQVDGGEIHAHRWMRPAAALAAQGRSEIELPPPTFVTLTQLAGFETAHHALAAVATVRVETFAPRLHAVPDGAVTLYAGDAAYDAGDLQQPGPRHRLWMIGSAWHYERTHAATDGDDRGEHA